MKSAAIAILATILLTLGNVTTASPTDECISLEMQYLLLALVGVIFLLFAFIYSIYKYRRLIKQKNIVLVEHVNRELCYLHELHTANERIQNLTALLKQHATIADTFPLETKGTLSANNLLTKEESRNLYEELNSIIVKRMLYLNPDLSRDNLLQIIHLNKNHFARMLQKNSGFKLTDYLNNLRIEHALVLLKTHPDHTVQAIAANSGFNNMSTFYILFKQKVGMTPSEYKSALDKANRWQPGYQDYII